MVRFLFLVLLFSIPDMGFAQDVTWNEQISCIVYTHCTPCHNELGIAPFALESYEEAYAYRYSMEAAISQRVMPPWPPNVDYNHLAGQRTLSEDEIALFKNWGAHGAPEGDPAQELAPPVYTTNLEIPDPDFSLRLPAFTVPDLRELDLYRCFVIPTNEEEDRYITGIEIVPGNRRVVHHVILFQDTTGTVEQLDAEDPELGYTCFGGIGTESISILAAWAPGASASFSPEGMGIFLPKGATLVAQIHYPEGTAGEIDSTLVNLKFSDAPDLRRIENLPALSHFFGIDRPLYIPAGTRQEFKATLFPVPFKVTITGIAPHAHLICESMKAFATTISGDTIPLIDIPHWDFEWQGFYQFRKPVIIPAFSTLHGFATYNNTTSNVHLPADLPTDVYEGEATTDEMMLFFMSISLYEEGDEHMIIDTTSHRVHHLDCQVSELLSPVHETSEARFIIAPTPASDHLIIRSDLGQYQRDFVLTDMLGRIIIREPIDAEIQKISLPSSFHAGVYFARMESQKGPESSWRKILITH